MPRHSFAILTSCCACKPTWSPCQQDPPRVHWLKILCTIQLHGRKQQFFATLIDYKQILALFYWDFCSVYIPAYSILHLLSTLNSCVFTLKQHWNAWLLHQWLQIRLRTRLFSWPGLLRTVTDSCSGLKFLHLPSAAALRPLPKLLLMQEGFHYHLQRDCTGCFAKWRTGVLTEKPFLPPVLVEFLAALSFPLEREQHLCSFGS